MIENIDFGKLPETWTLEKISEVSERVSVGYVGITSPFFTNAINGIPLIRSQNIRNGKINFENLAYVTKEFHSKNKKSHLKKGDVVVVRVGENRGDTCIINNEFDEVNCANVVFFRPLKEYGKFIELFLRSPLGQHSLESLTTGSAQGVINTKAIAELVVPLPPQNEAVQISELFESIDDKIDLLHRQNKTLEQLAETLFRQWFVEDQNLHEIIELGTLVDTINGVSYKSSELNPSKTAMVSLKSFDRNGGFRIDGFKEFTGKFKEQQIVNEGDLIVAHTDITQDAEVIGNPALVLGNPKYTTMVISMDMVKVIPKVNWVSIEFLYYLMRTREFKGHCEGNANGSTVLHLNKQAIPTFEFKKPKKEIANEFTKHAKELTSKIFKNHKQIRSLTQLRDTLLPKLMSGEVRIEYSNNVDKN